MKKRGLPYLDAVVGDIIIINMDQLRHAKVMDIILGASNTYHYFCEVYYTELDKVVDHHVFRGEVLHNLSFDVDDMVAL